MPRPCHDDHPPSPQSCHLCALCAERSRRGRAYRGDWGEPWPWPGKGPRTAVGDCRHLGGPTGATVRCPTCRGGVELKLFACAVYGECTPGKCAPGVACCQGGRCPSYEAKGEGAASTHKPAQLSGPDNSERLYVPVTLPPPRRARPKKWAYGVMAVEARLESHLPRTLASLKAAGFDRPRLFADGVTHAAAAEWERRFGLAVTARSPRVRTHANWVLSFYELYLREPAAERFAVFQDDMVCVRGLREYLDNVPYPEKGYENLYTFPSNQSICPDGHVGFFESNQFGRGAVALVFDRKAAMALLSAPHMVERAQDAHRGHRAVDGGIVTAMRQQGYREMVHSPSLVQHTGERSSMGNKPHPLAPSFPGEQFDALSLLTPAGMMTADKEGNR
jgi:hypothetical protein